MKKLLSFIASEYHLEKIGGSWKELEKLLKIYDIDGIEIMTGGYYNPKDVNSIEVVGHHFLYFPSWIHMWLEDKEELIKEFETLEYAKKVYGGWGKKRLIEFYKNEILDSQKMKSEYLVFHVAHVGLDEVFGDNFKYGQNEVLEYTADLINEIFEGVEDGPLLLFENLWWPGMDLLDDVITENFIKKIKYKNTGIMLDISHLILTSKNIYNYSDVEEYINENITASPILKKLIKGIHLNSTFPDFYRNNNLIENKRLVETLSSRLERYKIILDHITNLDTHKIYDDFSINKIIMELEIKYLVFEFKWNSKEELEKNLEKQNKVLLI
jgi:sugar phosphate isomerase/epimerase